MCACDELLRARLAAAAARDNGSNSAVSEHERMAAASSGCKWRRVMSALVKQNVVIQAQPRQLGRQACGKHRVDQRADLLQRYE